MTRDLARVFAGSKDEPDVEDCCMSATTTPPVGFRAIGGVQIRYAGAGGPHKRAVVLTGPWLESVCAFKPMWASLAEHARLFAVDLPGFGASGRRGGPAVSAGVGEFLAQLIAVADLGAPHIVAPDVGTAAAAWGGEPGG
jgi:pimeloyl-ACP methyl ester carboxylesterase